MVFGESASSDPAKLPHVRTHLQDLAQVKHEFSNIRPGLTTYAKKDLSTFNLNVRYGIDPSLPSLALNRRSDRGFLVYVSHEFLQASTKGPLINVPVKCHNTHVLLSGQQEGLNDLRCLTGPKAYPSLSGRT